MAQLTKPRNIYILGPEESGKSSLVRFLLKDFTCHKMKLGKRCYAKELDLNRIFEIPMLIDIKEYRGRKHAAKLPFQYSEADAVLLFYDCRDKVSFYKACDIQWKCHYFMYGTPPTFLVGNKSDLITTETVDNDLITEFRKKYPRINSHFQISVSDGTNIKELFKQVYEYILKNEKNKERSSNGNDNFIEMRYATPSQRGDFSTHSERENFFTHSQRGDLLPYDTNYGHPGICFIVNNSDFENESLNIREGSEEDVKNIKSTFSELGFKPICDSNLNVSTLRERMLNISQKDHARNNMFLCFIMSHGLPYSVFGVDGLPIDIKRLTDPFSGNRCPTLAKKPKVFIIQACQGTQKQKAAEDCDQAPEADVTAVRNTVPEYADILVGYSSINGYVSYRDPQRGSVYIRTLCETVKRCPDLHIIDILTIVNRKVAEMEFTVESDGEHHTNCKQLPMFESSLTKHAFLQHQDTQVTQNRLPDVSTSQHSTNENQQMDLNSPHPSDNELSDEVHKCMQESD